MGPEGRG
ncbi:hypothetical protein vcoNHCC006C_000194A, partial [Vibrio cholerae O1 str. NHCC-006C]